MEREQRTPNQRLRYERTNRGWSQKRVADALETTKELVSKWECGTQTPSKYYQEKLCLLFGKPASELGFLRADTFPPQKVETTSEMHTINALTEAVADTAQPTLGEAAAYAPLSAEHASPLLLQEHHLQAALAAVHPIGVNAAALTDPEPWERLSQSLDQPATFNPETFASFQQLLALSWVLSNAGELTVAEQAVLSFLPRMTMLASSRHEAAWLSAEGMRLRGILAAHHQRLQEKLLICLQAVEYARQAHDPTILVAQLVELAVAFTYARQPANSLKTYQEALSYCQDEQISEIVRARVYAASAATLAKHGSVHEAHAAFDHACTLFAHAPIHEGDILAADNGPCMLGYYHGLLYLACQQPAAAERAFEAALQPSVDHSIPQRWRLIIRNYQGRAAIASKQLEKYVLCLHEGIAGSRELGSQKRFDEALTIFQQEVPDAWRQASALKQLTDRFQLDQYPRREEELEI